MNEMKCICGKTARYVRHLRLNNYDIDGWKCDSCGEIYFNPEKAERILLLNKKQKTGENAELVKMIGISEQQFKNGKYVETDADMSPEEMLDRFLMGKPDKADKKMSIVREMENLEDMPKLDEYLAVEEAVQEFSGEFNRRQLWEKLVKPMK